MRRLALLLTGLLASAASALVLAQAAAAAESASLAVLDASGKVDPVQDIGRAFDFTVVSSSDTYFYATYRPSGGPACAPTAYSDSGDSIAWDESVESGSQHLSQTHIFGSYGSFLFCMWLGDWSSESHLVGSQTVTFRQPTGSVSFSSSPSTALIQKPVTLTFSGASEAPRNLYVTIRNSGGASCAPTASSDSGDSLIWDDEVNGSFSIPIVKAFTSPGNYYLCAWLADSSSDTQIIGGVKSFSFTVKKPTPKMNTARVKVRGVVRKGAVIFRTFSIQKAPAKSSVLIRCTKGCHVTEHLRTSKNGSAVDRTLIGKKLKKGSVISVYVTKPGWIGYYALLQVTGKRGLVTTQKACLAPTAPTKPVAC